MFACLVRPRELPAGPRRDVCLVAPRLKPDSFDGVGAIPSMNEEEMFCRQVRQRSEENRKAMALLHGAALLGQQIGLLRQELDSMIRVIYLLSVTDRARRRQQIGAAVQGNTWRGETSRRVTDREMVDLAQRLHGWVGAVYRFGCAFIHLSSYHDYKSRDPIKALASDERAHLFEYLRYYHGGPLNNDFTFPDIEPYLPSVFDKIASNLESRLQTLERGGQLDPHDMPGDSGAPPKP